MFKKYKWNTVIFCLAIFTLLITWINGAGEDTSVARNNYLSGQGNDFLGATGAWFYGSIPNRPLSWWHILLLWQIGITAIGLTLLKRNLLPELLGKQKLFFIILIYLGIMFASAQSRDGSIISFLILGFGLISFKGNKHKNLAKKGFIILGWIFLVFSFTFRPWLAIVLLPIYIFFEFLSQPKQHSYWKFFFSILICFGILTAPLFIDQEIKKITNLKNNYPEQIVMIHDFTATFCWSANNKTAEIAEKALMLIETNKKGVSQICQFFKPNTWQAVVGKAPGVPSTNGLTVPIKIINAGDSVIYSQLRSYWFKMILSDPFTYVQNHLAFGIQVLIAGDTRKIHLIDLFTKEEKDQANWLNKFLRSVYLFPIDFLLTFHLLSPLVTISLWFLFMLKRNFFKQQVYLMKIALNFLSIFVFWVSFTIIGFASDNGRYTLGGTYLLLFSLLFLQSIEKIKKE